jgi:tetratricopeptide (TPR) repeat protein
MTRTTFYICLLLVIASCKKKEVPVEDIKSDIEVRAENKKNIEESRNFESFIQELHTESTQNPEVVLVKADSLIQINNIDKHTVNDIAVNKTTELLYLKAGIYYRLGIYNESIETLNKVESKQGPVALGLIANYIKLQQPEKAALLVDHLGEGIRQEFAKGNYYECIGKVPEAIIRYESVIASGKQKGYDYYEHALKRCEELKKQKPALLSELYFPDGKIAYHT